MLTKNYVSLNKTYILIGTLLMLYGTINCSQNSSYETHDTTRSVSRRIRTPIPPTQPNPTTTILATPLLTQEQPQAQTLPHMAHVRTSAFLPPIMSNTHKRTNSFELHKMINIAHQQCSNPNYLDTLDHNTKNLYLTKIGVIIDHLSGLKSHFQALQSLITLYHNKLYESSDEIVTRSLCNLPIHLKALALLKNPMLLHKVTTPKTIVDQCATRLKAISKHPMQNAQDAQCIATILKAIYQEGDLETIDYMQEILPDEHDQGFIPKCQPNLQHLQYLANNDYREFLNTLAVTTNPDETIIILEDILQNHFKIPSGRMVTSIHKALINNQLPTLPIYKAWLYHNLKKSNTNILDYRFHSPKLFIWLKEIEETYPNQIEYSRHGISPETCQRIIQEVSQHQNAETAKPLLQDLESQRFTPETTQKLLRYTSNPELRQYLENSISGLIAANQRIVFINFVIWRYQHNAEPLATLLHPHEIRTNPNPQVAFYRQLFTRHTLHHTILPLLHENLSQQQPRLTSQKQEYADALFDAIKRNTSTFYTVLDKNSPTTVLELLDQHQLLDFKYSGIQYPYNSKPLIFAINHFADQALTDMYLYLDQHPNEPLAWQSFQHALQNCANMYTNDIISTQDLSDYYRPSLKILRICTLFCKNILQNPEKIKYIIDTITEWQATIPTILAKNHKIPCSQHTEHNDQCFDCLHNHILSYPWINDILAILKKYGAVDIPLTTSTF